MELLFLLPELFWSFLIIFLVCEFGEMISSRFIMFNDCLEQCNWYSFPIEMQRMYIIVTVTTQRHVVLHAFGNAECSREANKKVRFWDYDQFNWHSWVPINKILSTIVFRQFRRASPISWCFVRWHSKKLSIKIMEYSFDAIASLMTQAWTVKKRLNVWIFVIKVLNAEYLAKWT